MSVARGSRTALVVVAALATAAPAAAQDPGAATLYCVGEGGPLGMATDLEHSVLLGEETLPAGARERRVEVDGVATRVVEAGPADADHAVVFVHGHPGSARDWDGLLEASSSFARTVAIDVPGYGMSDELAAQVQSVDGAAAYIGGILDQLGVDRAVLALHDFGGPWGLQWAVQHPDALTGAVLIDSGVFIDYLPHPFAFVWATPGAGEAQMASTTRDNWRASMQVSNPRGLPAEFVDRMYDNYDRLTRCAALRYYRAAFQNPNLGREQAEVLRQRPRPALVIWGEKDIFIPPEHAERQREAFPDAQVEIFEDSGHWPFVDNAERTRRLVVRFLRPRLRVLTRPRARAGARKLRVRVGVEGVLPAHEVSARLGRRNSSRPQTLEQAATLVVPLRRPLRPGRRVLTVTGRGLKPRRVVVRVRDVSRRRRAAPRLAG